MLQMFYIIFYSQQMLLYSTYNMFDNILKQEKFNIINVTIIRIIIRDVIIYRKRLKIKFISLFGY
jgi:hypothetical protein